MCCPHTWHSDATVPVMGMKMSEKQRGRGKALEQPGSGALGTSGIGFGRGQRSDGVWGSAPRGWRVGRLQEGQQVTAGDTQQLTFPILHRGREGPGGRSFADLRG